MSETEKPDAMRSGMQTKLDEGVGELLSIRDEVTKNRPLPAKFVDAIGQWLASPYFFFALLLFHVGWVLLNIPVVPWQPWDPYPFTFLATLASVEAPFITLLVLMHQQRRARIEELREELELQISLRLERQATMLLRLVRELQARTGVETRQDETELEHLQEQLQPKALADHLREKINREEGAEKSTSA